MQSSALPSDSTKEAETCVAQTLHDWPSVQWLNITDSTNAQLLAQARTRRSPVDWPRFLASNHQTKGRGRQGRQWLDKPGNSLMFSCGFMTSLPARILPGLAPALGMVACQTLRSLAGPDKQSIKLKWPNDIMLDHGKLAGILVESRIQGSSVFVVAGIGINLKKDQRWETALNRQLGQWHALSGAESNRAVIAAKIAAQWKSCMESYNEKYLNDLVAACKDIDYLAQKNILVFRDGQIIESGACLGMTGLGELEIQLGNGQRKLINVGEVSVRPDGSHQDLIDPVSR